MGRMSAHTGEQITWEEAMAAEEDLFPNEENLQWDQSFEPEPVAMPGKTKIVGIGGYEGEKEESDGKAEKKKA